MSVSVIAKKDRDEALSQLRQKLEKEFLEQNKRCLDIRIISQEGVAVLVHRVRIPNELKLKSLINTNMFGF